jgi:hypothetical protein
MPFVKRQRKYYKDGVEVPSSSITDFGSYKYFKNIVTTKYWKEITTEVEGDVLAYAAYYYKKNDLLSTNCLYAKAPIGSDFTIYVSKSSAALGWANGVNDITTGATSSNAKKFTSVTEESALAGFTAKRQYDKDLYTKGIISSTETVEGTPEDYTYTTEEIVPVEVTADDDYDYTEFVPSTQYDYHVDNNKLYTPTRRRREYYKYGTEPNVGVTGTFARIDKGVASGFSGSNYLTLPMDFNPLSSPWCITTAIHFVDGSSGQRIFGSKGNVYGLALQTHTSTKTLHLYGSSNGSSWNLMSDLRGVTPLVDGTDYWVKMEYSGSQYIVSLSTNGVDWNDEITVNNATPVYAFKTFYIGSNATETFLFGSIDLSQSYININGERWWSGDSYTKVGSWIDDGVASGFTTANYLTTPKVFNPLGSEVECVFKVNLAALNRTNPMISQGANVQFNKFFFVVMKDGRIRFNAGTGSTTIVRVDSNVVLEINKDYWLKLHIKDNVYSLYYSLDGVDYIFDNSVEDADIIREMTTTAYIGANRDPATGSSSYFNGSIDLQKSYIKINGEDWWHGTKIVRLNVSGEDAWEDWEQPVLTSDTSSSKIVLSSSSTYGSNYPMWGAFDNGSGAWLSEDRTGSGSLRVSFPSKLKISRITVTGWGNTTDRTKAITIYKDFDNTEVAGDTQTFDGAVTKTWIFDTPIITNRLSFYAESTTGYWACIDEIKITAQQLMSAGTIEDADYYVDRNVAYDIRS